MKKEKHVESIDVRQKRDEIDLIIYRAGDDGNITCNDYTLTMSDVTDLIEKLLDASERVLDVRRIC